MTLLSKLIFSLKTPFTLTRFSSLSVISAALDYGLFVALLWLSDHVFFSIILARLISCAVNFFGGKHFTFRSAERTFPELQKYIALAGGLIALGYGLISFLEAEFGLTPYIGKVISEITLFPISFLVQQKLVFKRSP